MNLPSDSDAYRNAIIRDRHQQLSKLGTTSFKNTALRLGIAEAEVIYAHSEVCHGITPIALGDTRIWEIICAHPCQWHIQLGEKNAWVKMNDALSELNLMADFLTMAGDNWKLMITNLSHCHTFAIGCNNPNSSFRITAYDDYGRAQAVFMPQDKAIAATIKQEVIGYARNNPKYVPPVVQYKQLDETSKPIDDSSERKSFITFMEECRKRDLHIYFRREGQFKSIITGRFVSHEQNGREFYYNIGGHDLLLDFDSVHTVNYVSRGMCVEAFGDHGVRYVVGLIGEAPAHQVLSWMELIEDYKATV